MRMPRLWGVVLVAAVAAYACGLETTTSGNRTTRTTEFRLTRTTAAPPTTTGYPRDGQFEFRGITASNWSGDSFLCDDGNYIRVSMTVENIGTREQDFSEFAQSLYVDGVEAENKWGCNTDQEASIGLRPGGQTRVQLIFEVPSNWRSRNVILELHDSAFSGGVDVRL